MQAASYFFFPAVQTYHYWRQLWTFVGLCAAGVPQMSDAHRFWTTTAEPHAARRRTLLRDHPEVRALCGPEWRSKYIALGALVLPQLWLAWATRAWSWPAYLLVAYAVGATLAQALFLAIHELSHNLFFAASWANQCFAVVVNLPLVVPFCAAFRAYHLEHHAHQGVEGVDTDLPSHFECRWVRGRAAKALWVSLQLTAYALRPLLVRPKAVTSAHVGNWLVQLAFNAGVWLVWGWPPLGYLALCALLAGGCIRVRGTLSPSSTCSLFHNILACSRDIMTLVMELCNTEGAHSLRQPRGTHHHCAIVWPAA